MHETNYHLKNSNKDVNTMRLFIGINLPNEIKQTLLEFQSELRQLGVRGGGNHKKTFI